MKGYHIKFIRHGKTEGNLNATYIGLTDIPLCEDGKSELFEKLDKYDYASVQKVYTSPLLRCKQTAGIIYPNSYTVTVNELREMNFGEFEGKSTDELINLSEYKDWLKGGLDNPAPNGESLRSLVQRCLEGMDFIIKDMMDEGLTNCAVVTHGGVIMNTLAGFGLPKHKPMEFACDFGDGFEIVVTAQMWQRSSAFEIIGKFPYNIYNNNTDD